MGTLSDRHTQWVLYPASNEREDQAQVLLNRANSMLSHRADTHTHTHTFTCFKELFKGRCYLSAYSTEQDSEVQRRLGRDRKRERRGNVICIFLQEKKIKSEYVVAVV